MGSSWLALCYNIMNGYVILLTVTNEEGRFSFCAWLHAPGRLPCAEPAVTEQDRRAGVFTGRWRRCIYPSRETGSGVASNGRPQPSRDAHRYEQHSDGQGITARPHANFGSRNRSLVSARPRGLGKRNHMPRVS